MRNATIAIRFLTLVTTPDRATAIAGDLLEEASNRGDVWFWVSVLQTVGSHILEGLSHHPGRMLWLAFSALAEMWLIATIVLNAVIDLWLAGWPYHLSPNATYIPPWVFYGLLIAVNVGLPLLAGWDAARRSKGHELAAGAAVMLLLAAGTAAHALATGALVHHSNGSYPYTQYTVVSLCIAVFGPMGGALVFRLRSSRIGMSG